MIYLPMRTGAFSRAVSAEAVNNGVTAVHRKGVFVPEMREDFFHKRAVHVNELPASAAFDQFKNFMVRGDFFKKLIKEL